MMKLRKIIALELLLYDDCVCVCDCVLCDSTIYYSHTIHISSNRTGTNDDNDEDAFCARDRSPPRLVGRKSVDDGTRIVY